MAVCCGLSRSPRVSEDWTLGHRPLTNTLSHLLHRTGWAVWEQGRGGGVDIAGPRLQPPVFSGFSVLLLSPAADPVRPETVILPATVKMGMKAAPWLWPR